MNFLRNLRRFGFIFFALIFRITPGMNLSALDFQEFGSPHVQTYLPGTYTYANHYNSIVQDDQGFIYIGARNSILRFDGTSWKHIPVRGAIHLLSNEGKIYGYGRDRLGFFGRDPSGEPQFMLSMTAGIHPGTDLNGDILKVLPVGGNLFILTSAGVYVHGDGETSEILPEYTVLNIYPSGEGIFFLAGGNRLFHYRPDEAEEIPLPRGMGHPTLIRSLADKTLFYEESSKNLQLNGSGGDDKELPQTAALLGAYGYSCAAGLSSGELAIGSRSGGVIIVSAEGEVERRIGTGDGLYSDEIVDLYADRSGNLWALHEDALSRIEIHPGFSYFDTRNGLQGNIKDLLRHEGILYAASSRGLFRLKAREQTTGPADPGAEFEQVPGVEGDFRCLAGVPGKLLAGSNEGMVEIAGTSVRQILSDPVNVLFYYPINRLILVGTDRGLRIFRLDGWEEIRNFSLPDVSIDDIALSPSGFLWLSSCSGALYRSTRELSDAGNLTYSSYPTADLDSIEGVYIDLVNFSGTLFFAGLRGLFRFDPVRNAFYPDTLFNLPGGIGSFRAGQIVRDRENSIWIRIDHPDQQTACLWQARREGERGYSWHPSPYGRINSRIVNCLYPDNGNILWIGTHQGILRFIPGFEPPPDPAFRTHISRVSIADEAPMHFDSLRSDRFSELMDEGGLRIPWSKNDIRFDFLSTAYNCEGNPSYQFRLSGGNDQWSSWSTTPFAEYRQLNMGSYRFQVRSRDVFGAVSEPDSFPFTIRAPVYLRWYAIIVYAILLLILLFILQRLRNIQIMREQYHLEEVVQERTESLLKEKEKTDTLLANILPKTTAEELKTKGKVASSKFKMVTVLFADIQGFTKIAEHMNPDKLIDQLDRFYFHFDSVVEKYNIEKIKTIGDAYMAAGGIPIKNRTNPVDVVLAALEMQTHMKKLKETNADIWDLRIGIHTGSVIAGVVGQKKYSYDIWGDTVNTASRMESSGEIGRVNISATTYKLIKDFFQCEFRGKMPVKYKGDIAMFFVNGLNPTYSEADKITPNARFYIQIQLLRLLDLEEFILEKLEKELPENLFFHNVEHTSHVYAQVELLGRGEKVSDEDLLLLRTSALLHDIGYIDGVNDHEARSVEYAREILPVYRYKEDQIDRICELIMATIFPPKPKNLLEQIICDANLDHIGRVDFLIQSDKLFQEYRMNNKVKSKKEWNQEQIRFLETHDFYTSIANRMREVPKEQQIKNIRQFS